MSHSKTVQTRRRKAKAKNTATRIAKAADKAKKQAAKMKAAIHDKTKPSSTDKLTPPAGADDSGSKKP